MSTENFRIAINFIKQLIIRLGLGGSRDHMTIQYVGGELLTVPERDLSDCVVYARQQFMQLFKTVVDGAQSNLIGSKDRVLALSALFNNRVGSSVDNFGSSRTVSGSSDKYRTIFLARHEDVSLQESPVPSIFVVDKNGVKFAEKEMQIANRKGYGLTLRPVFQGGSAIETASVEEIKDLYGRLFDEWFMRSRVIVQPFFHLLTKRMARYSGDEAMYAFNQGCPFQNDCAKRSLDLEPNGDLYICLDMADSKQYRLGNALTGEFDEGLWGILSDRENSLDESCLRCDYLKECQGGCMSEAIAFTERVNGKTGLCEIWKTVFARIDRAIAEYGIDRVSVWISKIEDFADTGSKPSYKQIVGN